MTVIMITAPDEEIEADLEERPTAGYTAGRRQGQDLNSDC